MILAEIHEASGFWSEYLHLVTDLAHVAFEMTYEVISFALVYVFGWRRGKRRAIKEHDSKFHPGHSHDDEG